MIDRELASYIGTVIIFVLQAIGLLLNLKNKEGLYYGAIVLALLPKVTFVPFKLFVSGYSGTMANYEQFTFMANVAIFIVIVRFMFDWVTSIKKNEEASKTKTTQTE